MSQHDFNIANQTFPNFRTDVNNALAAITSLQSGASAPSTTVAYMLWADTTNNVLKQRNSSDDGWIIRGSLGDSLVLAKTADYTITLAEHQLLVTVDASGANRTVTLPTLASAGAGLETTIKKIDSSTNTVTVDGNGSETIDGATTIVLSAQYAAITIISGASEWHISADSRQVVTTQGDIVIAGLDKAATRLAVGSASEYILQTVTATATANGDYTTAWGTLWETRHDAIGGIQLSTATEVQAGTNGTKAIPADLLLHHPLMPVAVGSFHRPVATATQVAPIFGHNVGNMERISTGVFDIFLSVDMATVTTTATHGWYPISAIVDSSGGNPHNIGIQDTASDVFRISVSDAANHAQNPEFLSVIVYGNVATATM